jgi:hypothetical protein
VLHRSFLADAPMVAHVEGLVKKGWTIVSDIDDDPHHWPGYVNADFRAFRGVHAVTVSTEPLAEMVRQWNPNVAVFPNQAFRLPDTPATTPKGGARMRVFFGALNRQDDWAAVRDQIMDLAERHADRIEWIVVHDESFFDALPPQATKTFHPTLPHARFMAVLAQCDIALLPLVDTPFNRLKSDLKLVECASAGVVPVCSRLIYDTDPAHADFAIFADGPQDWRDALLALIVSPDEVRRRRDLARNHVSTHRMHALAAPAREAYYRDLVARREDLERQRQRRIAAMAASSPVTA